LYAAGADTPMEGWDLTLSHDGAFAAAALCAVTIDSPDIRSAIPDP
jgi:hypothetical protein